VNRMFVWSNVVPVNETDLEEVRCSDCDVQLIGTANFDYDGSFYCDSCVQNLVDATEADARSYVKECCAITCPLPKYEPEFAFSCSPEEYKRGERESYTPMSMLCHYRHHCTNYEELIEDLEKDSIEDKVYYLLIRARTMELISEAIRALGDDSENEFLHLINEDDWAD
jgi:hypothetical protein